MKGNNNHARSEQNRKKKAQRMQSIVQLHEKAAKGNEKAINAVDTLANQLKMRQNFDAFMRSKKEMPPVRNQRQRRKLSRQMGRKVA